jgi:hypothetical protein
VRSLPRCRLRCSHALTPPPPVPLQIVLDCLKPLTHKRIIERELEGFGIRLNKKPPNITFR